MLPVRVRVANSRDEAFVRELAGEVFSLYGDYRPLLPQWFEAEGVTTYISEQNGERTGYVMLAFFREGKELVGDILAIAVAPSFQGRGIGRMLLQHALDISDQVAEREPVRAVRLSVAATNDRARHLFETCGFRLVEGDFGTYQGGQKALHMERPTLWPG
jgi:ribosomal protein S18 acetylase RimI-like enzyme